MAKKQTTSGLQSLLENADSVSNQIQQTALESVDYGDTGLGMRVEGADSKYFTDKQFSPDFYEKEGAFAEYQAQEQDWLDKLGNTTVKWGGIAGTTFFSTFTSLPVGLLAAAGSGDVSMVWNNPIAKGFNDINKYLEEKFPHYETQKEKAASWKDPDYWWTTNFLTNTILKNTGYLVGTQGAMKGVSASLYNVAKGVSADYAAGSAKYAQLIESGMSAAEAAKQVGRLVNRIDSGIKGATVTIAALGEGSMEALGAAEEFEKNQIAYYMSKYGITDENDIPQYIREDIKDKAKQVGNTTLALNLPLLMGQDLLLFGKSIKQGYKAEKKLLGNITGDGMTSAFETAPINKSIERAKALAKPLYEVFEEGSQYASAETAKDFYDLRNDGNEKNNLWDFLASAGRGIEKTFSTKEGITSMISGGITGYLPGAGFAQVRQDLANINKIDPDTQAAIEALNKYSVKETFKNRAESIVRGQAIENQKQEALNNNNEFAYKNAELDGLKNMYLAYKDADKLDLLKEQLEDAKKLNPAEFAETFTASEDMFKEKSVAEHVSSIEKQIEEFEAIKDNVELLFSNPKGPSAEVAFSASADIQDSQKRQASLKQEINKSINDDARNRAHLVNLFDGGDIKTANQTIESILNQIENPLVAKALKPKMQDWYNLEVRKQQAIAKLKGLETVEQQESFDKEKTKQTQEADKKAADNAKTNQTVTEAKAAAAGINAKLNADLENEEFSMSPEEEFGTAGTPLESVIDSIKKSQAEEAARQQTPKQDPTETLSETTKRGLEAAKIKKTENEVLQIWHNLPKNERHLVQEEFKQILSKFKGIEPEAIASAPKQTTTPESTEPTKTLLNNGSLNKMYSNSYSMSIPELEALIKSTTPAEFMKNTTIKFEKHDRGRKIVNGILTPSVDVKIFHKGKVVGFFPYVDIVPVNSNSPEAGNVKLQTQSATWLAGNRIIDTANAEQLLNDAKGLSGIYNYIALNNLFEKEISLDSLSNILGVQFTNGQINLLTDFKYKATEIEGTNIDGTYYVIDRGEEEDGGSLIDASIKDLKDYYKETFSKNLEDVLKETYGSDDLFKAAPKLGRYITISILPNGVVTFVASRPNTLASEDVQKEINSILEVRNKAVDTEVTNDKGEKTIEKLIPVEELDKINKKTKSFFISDGSGTAKNPSGFTITLRISPSGKLYFDYNNRKVGERSKKVYVSNPNAVSLKDILTSVNQSIDTNKLGLPKITEQSFRASIPANVTNQQAAESLITAVDKSVRSTPDIKFTYNTPVIEQELANVKAKIQTPVSGIDATIAKVPSDKVITTTGYLSDLLPFQTETVKPGVSELFESNPELANIGTLEQYSQYLNTIGVTDIAYHHSESDLENFRTFPEGYFPQALKKKGTHYKKADDVVFFVKKPLTEEFMSQRKFKSAWGLKVPNMLQFNAGEKINEGVHPGIDKGVKAAIDGDYDAVDFGRIRDNKTWSEVIAITNPNNAVKLGSKQDIKGFKEFIKNLQTPVTEVPTNKYALTENDDFDKEPTVEESVKVINESVRGLKEIEAELEAAKNSKDIEAIKRLTAEKISLSNKLDASDTPKVRKNKGGASFKLKEELTGVDQGTEITFEEAKKLLKDMLPESISVELLGKVINDLKTDNIQGAYSVMDKMLYLKERTTDKLAYHEAFHAVFETVLTDEEIARVLGAAKVIYGIPHTTELQAFAIKNKFTRLSVKEQLDRWYNEKMAEDFEKKVKGKPNSKLKNTIIGKILDKINTIVDWFKDVFNSTNINSNKRIISSLFDGITTGKYKSYKPTTNRFTKDNVSFKLIKSGYITDEDGTYPKYLPLVEGKKAVSTIAAKLYNAVRQKESSEKSKYDGWTTEAILDDIIAAELEFNSLDNEVNSNLLTSLEGKKFDEFIDTLTDLSFVYSNEESINTIKAEVREIYKAINFNAEEKEDQEDRTIDDKGEKWGEESWAKGGFGELSKAIRQYIAFTTYETTDEFGRTYTTAVDVNRVYNGLTRALAGTRGNDMLNKLEQHAEWNEEANKVWEKLKADTGLIKSEEGIWQATIDENLLNGFITSFNREFVEYTATLFDPTTGKFKVFNANTFDVDKQQVDKWSNNYIALQSDIESGNKPELKNKILNIFKNLDDTLKSKKKLNKLQLKQEVETIKKDLDFVGVTLSPGYIAWSIIANKSEENRTKEQQEFYLSYVNDVQPINFISGSKSTTVVLSEIVSKGTNPFEVTEDTDSKDEGAKGRMLKLAKYNAMFDETVGSSSFQNADNKQVFDKIYGSYVIEATKELRDSNKIKQLLKDKFLKNNILLNNTVALELFKDARIKLIDGIRQTTIGSIADNINKEGEGLTYGDFDPRSYALQNLIMFSNQKDIKDQEGNLLGKSALYNFRQLEASSTGYAMELPVETYYDSKGMTNKALGHLMNNFIAEFDRIGKVFKEIESGKNLIKDYHTPNKKGIVRGLEFWNYGFLKTSLTEKQYNEVLNSARRNEGIESVSEETKQAIKDSIKANFEAEIQQYKDKLLELGVLKTQDKTGNIINNLLPADKEASKGIYDPKYKGNIDTFLGDFYLNDLINSWAFNEILDGDYAEGRKDPVDAVKRHKGSMASGPSLGDGTHVVSYIEDPQSFIDPNDPELKELSEELGGSKIDIADAQSWVSLKHKRLQMLRWGKLTPKVAAIYDKIEKGEEVTWEEKVYLEKQGAALNSGKTVTFDGKRYHKLSEITLTKRMVAYKDSDGTWKALPGKEILFDMYNQMNNTSNPIDQVIAASGSKLATKVPSKLVDGKYNLSESATVVENRYKRLQVETPSGKLKITAGTQFMQLIDSELDGTLEVDFNGEVRTLDSLRAEYQSLLANVRDNAIKDLISQIFDEKTQTVKLTKAAKKFLETMEASGADDNMIEFFSLNANGEPKYDYNLVNIIDKFEQLFLAHFTKEGFSQKRPGLKVSLVSGHGYKIARDVNGNVVSARDIQNDPKAIERVAKDADGNYITTELRYNVKDADGKYYSECVIPAWLKKMFNLEKGDIIPEQALKMIGYRIPTQDKHSMMALKVVDFLPAEYGSVGIFPKQIVYLSGADFDIDSEFIQRALPYFKTNSEGKTIWKFFGNAKTDEEKFEEYTAYNDKYNKDVTKLIENLKENSSQYQKDLATAKNIKVWLKNYVKPAINSRWSKIKEYHKVISELEHLLETGTVPEDTNIDSIKEQMYSLQVKLSSTYDDLDKYARSIESYKNEAVLKYYDPTTESGDTLGGFLDMVKETEEYFRLEAFRQLGLATTQKEFNTLPESKKITKGAIDNNLLKLELEFLTNESIRKEVAITPAGTGRMEDVAKYISNLTKDTPHEVNIEDTANVHGALGKLNANTKNAVGKENIGPAAIANVIHSMLSKSKVILKDKALKFNGEELAGYGLNTKDGKILDLDGDRVNDNISSVLSQMTDEAKNPLSELLNLPIDILGSICNALAQGLPLKTAMLFSSQPMLRQYAKQLAVNKYAIKTRGEDVYKKQVINNLLDDITKIIGEETVSKIEDLNLTTEELEKALSSKEYDTDFYITQYKVLSQYQKLDDQTSNYFNKIKFITSALTKGLPSSINEMAKFDSAIKELGLESVAKGEETLANKNHWSELDSDIPFDIREAVLNHKLTLSNLKNYYNISKNLIPKFFITETAVGKRMWSILKDNLKASLKEDVLNSYKKDLLSYMSIQAYKKHLADTNQEDVLATINSNLLNSDKTLADRLIKIKSDNRYKNNKLVNYLVATLQNNKNNKTGIGLVAGRIRVKENPQYVSELIDAYQELYNDPLTHQFANDLFNYLIVKDGLQFRTNSFVKYISPFMFKEISKSNKKITSALSDLEGFKNPEAFASVFGTNPTNFLYSFLESTLRHSENQMDIVYFRDSSKIQAKTTSDKATMAMFRTEEVKPDNKVEKRIVFNIFQAVEKDPATNRLSEKGREQFKNNIKLLTDFGLNSKSEKYVTKEGEERNRVKFEFPLYMSIKGDGLFKLSVLDKETFEGNFIESGPSLDESETIPSGAKAVYIKVSTLGNKAVKSVGLELEDLVGLTQRMQDVKVTPKQPAQSTQLTQDASSEYGMSPEQEFASETSKIQGVEISSNAKGLAGALTNPTELSKSKGNITQSYPVTYKGKTYKDAEAAYQALKSTATKDDGPNNTYNLMVDIIKTKLEQYPRLVEEITKQGGSEWILSSTHQPTKQNSVWETGGKNWFIKSLNEAYTSIAKNKSNDTNKYAMTEEFEDEDFSNMNIGMLESNEEDFSAADLGGNVTSLEESKKQMIGLFPEHSDIINNAKTQEELKNIIKKYCK